MLVLLLVLLDHATARAPLHEHFFEHRLSDKEFGTDYGYVDKAHKEIGTDYGYVDVYSEHVTKSSQKEIGMDYGYLDVYSEHASKASKRGGDYAYEYKGLPEGFRSGAVDPEVATFEILNSAFYPRNASVGSRMWKVLTRQRGLLGVRKALQTTILGRLTSFPSSFPKISGLTGGDQGEEAPLRGKPYFKVAAQKMQKCFPQASCSDGSSLHGRRGLEGYSRPTYCSPWSPRLEGSVRFIRTILIHFFFIFPPFSAKMRKHKELKLPRSTFRPISLGRH